MATVTGLRLIKAFPYRGASGEEFSNGYHFKSAPPGNDESWTVLMNDVVELERKVFPPEVTYVRAYGYDSSDDNAVHVFQHDFSLAGPPPAGTFIPGAGTHPMAGDQAAFVSWTTDGKSSKGKTIYLRKFFHAGSVSGSNFDQIDLIDYAPALVEFAEAVRLKHGGLRSANNDVNVLAAFASHWVTTRTLKHRGKRGGPKA